MLVQEPVRFQGKNEIISYLFAMTAEILENDNQPLKVTGKETQSVEISVVILANVLHKICFYFSTSFSLVRSLGLLLPRKPDK